MTAGEGFRMCVLCHGQVMPAGRAWFNAYNFGLYYTFALCVPNRIILEESVLQIQIFFYSFPYSSNCKIIRIARFVDLLDCIAQSLLQGGVRWSIDPRQ